MAADACRIDEVCDNVEEAWRAGPPPRLEEHLGAVEELLRPALLRQLLLLEWDYLLQQGGRLEVDDYLGRFPEHTALIHETVEEHLGEPASLSDAPPAEALRALPADDWKEQGYLLVEPAGPRRNGHSLPGLPDGRGQARRAEGASGRPAG